MNYLRTIDGKIYRITRYVLTGYLVEDIETDIEGTRFIDAVLVDKISDKIEDLICAREDEK